MPPIESPSLKGPTVVVVPSLLDLVKVTVVAIDVVEVQVRVEDEDPGVNTRGLVMVGIPAWREHTVHVKYGHVGLMFDEKVSGLVLKVEASQTGSQAFVLVLPVVKDTIHVLCLPRLLVSIW